MCYRQQESIDMKIGIIGAGFIGRAVAELAVSHGHHVMISNSRGPETLHSLASAVGCEIGTAEESAEFGEIVLIAIPLKNYRSMPVAALAGKVVLDANNYYPERDGQIVELDTHQTTTSELLAQHLPTSKIVKAFNSIRVKELEVDGQLAGTSNRRALPIAGDDAEAKQQVSHLLDQFGFDTLDAGPLAQGRLFERGTAPYCVRYTLPALKQALAI
ncbi:NADPH-dependent F420 reductase [Yersinia canariae]|uniref:NADPH-dependent F420 reductase n=1 Tax=Yersinia canariae TaxID=2607663 RepID=UPI002167FA68|nr:NAD(P)-binding domain-containing protein [Yersinia canariae]